MRLLQLSERHRPYKARCNVCERYSNRCVRFRWEHVHNNVTTLSGLLDMCAGCLRVGSRIATKGRKAVRVGNA